MTVHTYLLDFTVEPKTCETLESRKSLKENVQNCLKEYINDLRCESFTELDGGFLAVLVGAFGTFVTIRAIKQGIVTVNIEYYKPEEDMLTFERIRSLDSLIRSRINSKKSHKLPPIKRGGVDRYFWSSDERLLEYDIDKIVFEEMSPYQKIQIVHSKTLGNILLLDDLQNMSESDLIYTETLMQRGIENYEDKEIIILGGGDGCLLWELLKEKPKFVTMLELDEVVIKACSKYLRSSCGNCLDNYKGDRYEIIVGDCFETLEKFINEGKKVKFQSYLPAEKYEKLPPFKPVVSMNLPSTPLASATIYRESYQNNGTVPRPLPVVQGGNLNFSTQPMSNETTARLSYTGVVGEKAVPFKPIYRNMMGSGPMQSVTTQRHDYIPKPIDPVESFKPRTSFQPSSFKMENITTFRASYLPNEGAPPAESCKPPAVYRKSEYPLDSDTINRLSYQPFSVMPKEEYPWMKKPRYQQPQSVMDNTSIYRGSYLAPGSYVPDGSGGADDVCDCQQQQSATEDL